MNMAAQPRETSNSRHFFTENSHGKRNIFLFQNKWHLCSSGGEGKVPPTKNLGDYVVMAQLARQTRAWQTTKMHFISFCSSGFSSTMIQKGLNKRILKD